MCMQHRAFCHTFQYGILPYGVVVFCANTNRKLQWTRTEHDTQICGSSAIIKTLHLCRNLFRPWTNGGLCDVLQPSHGNFPSVNLSNPLVNLYAFRCRMPHRDLGTCSAAAAQEQLAVMLLLPDNSRIGP